VASHTPKPVQQDDAESPRDIPERSLTQRMDALQEANRIRAVRARLKKDLKGGRKFIQDILLTPNDDVKAMKLIDLVLACPKIGRVKANKVLQQTRISPSKTIGGLSERQRMELVVKLKKYPN
jgi:S13-like protein